MVLHSFGRLGLGFGSFCVCQPVSSSVQGLSLLPLLVSAGLRTGLKKHPQ